MTRYLVKLIDNNRRWTAVAIKAKSPEVAESVALSENPMYVAARASVHRFQ